MFGTYLRRELRRRARQSSIIVLGLALGIGLVITVTALSSGVKNAQSSVLHSLYGMDTDITVTQTPAAGSGGARGFGFAGGFGNGQNGRPKAGTKVSVDNLTSTGLGTLTAANVSSVGKMSNVAAVAGGLTLSDTKLSITIPNFSANGGGTGGGFNGGGGNSGGGSFRGSGSFPTPISVDGTDLAGNAAALGPLSTAKISSGRTLSAADANSNVALLDSNYAKSSKLTVGSSITLAKTKFTIVGMVSQPAAGNPPDVYIPLARAQALGTAQGKTLKGDVNTIYVTADSAATISTVSKEISGTMPKATITNSSDLASQLTGSLSSASSLASNLGKWLAIAVLVAAFLLASLLTMSAVSRRVREFGTLKALGWRSRRVDRPGHGRGRRHRRHRRHRRRRARVPRRGAGRPGFTPPLTASSARPPERDTRRRADVRRRRRLRRRWRRRFRRRRRRRFAGRFRPPARTRHTRRRAPDRAGHARRRSSPPCVLAIGRRPDRRHVRRLAGGPAAPGRGAGAGSNEQPAPRPAT